jgi:glycosyltransferase involved in cell wall biosynthesis
MQSKISILLLNYNGKKFNQFCIASILTQTYQHFEIFFIDNASTDGSVEEVEQKFKKEIQS